MADQILPRAADVLEEFEGIAVAFEDVGKASFVDGIDCVSVSEGNRTELDPAMDEESDELLELECA